MPNLADYPTGRITKVLFIGDSGTGKTGATLSLAKAGYNLRFMDFDAGLDILVGLLRKEPNSHDLLSRITFETITDPMKTLNGKVFPVAAVAWSKAMQLLDDWPGLGSITTWGENDILVVDSLTMAGKCATRFVQSLNGRLATVPHWTDYFGAQQLVESFTAMLYSTSVKCNVLVLSHVREIGKRQTVLDEKNRVVTVEEPDSRRGYAETGTGSALSPTIGRYFNAILLADIMGSGQSARRVIRTIPHENIGLKNPAPGLVKPVLDLPTGLAEYFATVRGSGASAPS